MQNLNHKTEKRKKHLSVKILAWIMLVAMLVEMFAFSCSAIVGGAFDFSGTGSGGDKVTGGINNFDSEEVIAQLKKDFLKSVNENLVRRIDEYKLTGEVGVILTFSDGSLMELYNASDKKMTFAEYSDTAEALAVKRQLEHNRTTVLNSLMNAGLIFDVKHTYDSLLDGAFVRTTFENIEAICNFEGVERVTVSNTYLPAVAVDNPVDVYDTGIFNSSSVDYTGKKSIVAILDTGCDYAHSAFTTHTVVDPLYDRDDIAQRLPNLIAYSYDTSIEVREVYYGNITGGKIAFGYDYADKDTDIMPFNSEHGTHVAGIIGGYDDEIVGVAIDTQFAIMKVFSDYEQGAEDGDILAALEDSIKLEVDAINMSLGSSCGFSAEYDPNDPEANYKNDLYSRIEAAGISLVVAASNDYSSGMGGVESNTNKTSNPDSATIGSPASYEASLAVASINGNKENYMFVNGNKEVFFNESYNNAADEFDFFAMLGVSAENPVVEMEYVTVPGLGYAINYAGIDVQNKIALVRRGDITFEEKIQHAYEAGAAAVIIYNNVFGEIIMTVGNDPKIPVISIGKDDGDAMAAQASGKVVFDFANEAGPFMSDFSSWGPTPDLKLKPEITAHGGNIRSAVLGGDYDELSGTSMAAPNMCGITVLIRQYVKENFTELSVTEQRDLVNQLCMSTATIAQDMKDHPYSPRKQGAGIADIARATTTPAYLYVDGIGKTKLELGDDPLRKGVYTMTINLKNISDKTVSYKLGNITMTESVSTSEPEYVAEMAYLLSNTADYSVSGGTIQDGVVSVEAGKTAAVTVTLKLSAADKSYLNSTFANGMYVEGFLTFDNTEENGIDLNAPFLAFYGDWGEAPIFDLDYYMEETEAHNNAIDEEDKIKADYYATTPLGSYYYDYILPLGCFVYKVDENKYSPIPGTREHAAVSYYKDAISGIYGVYTGLLRGAKEMTISIVDTATGEEVWSETQYNCYKSHYGGVPYPYVAKFGKTGLDMVDTETNEIFGYNNAHYEVTMTAKLDWNGTTRNSEDTYSFSFYIDYEAPTVTDATFRTEYDKSREENRYYVDIMVYDNHYAMSLRPVIVYDFVDHKGETKKTYSSLTEYPIPIYQENKGEVTKVTLEITDYIDRIASSATPDGLTIYVDDYAMNAGIAYIPFPETDSTDLEFVEEELTLDINQTLDLAKYLVRKDTTEAIETDYLKTLTWTSSDESVVAISGGKIEALKTGTATIKVTGSAWVTVDDSGSEPQEIPIFKTIKINVSQNIANNPESSGSVPVESLKFTYYDTLFAFSSDIDYSEIGLTDTFSYFEGDNPSIKFYPSEKIQLHYSLEPWNIDEDRYELKWSSSNPRVATVDENGVVVAEAEGEARISLQIIIDGKPSILAARCAVEVKSEFIIENRTLIAYKGKGGDVVIPDDEGILYIGSYAFCHYDFDNEKYVEKDENGYYDIDEKKDPIGNDTVKSIVIPEGVDIIEKYAFYNCTALEKVTVPTSCKTINSSAFAKCNILENINLDNVKIIANNAFDGCASLTCEDIGGINLAKAYAIGAYAFRGTRIDSVKLTNLSLTGEGAFINCEYLKTVELGTKTRVGKSMFQNTAVESIIVYSDIVQDNAFKNCKSLESVELLGNLTYLGIEAFSGCDELSSVNFAAGCEKIAQQAFYECTSLESIKLPNCKVAIDGGAFAGTALKNLIFDKKTEIASVGLSIFDQVSSLNVSVADSEVYKLVGSAIYTNDGKTLVMYLPTVASQDFTVPADVTHIADGAFASNKYVQHVYFEAGSQLASIGYAAFANCSELRSVTLPANAVAIDGAAFINTPMLASINLEKVTSVGENAFVGTKLTEVNLDTDNVVIGDYAFYKISTLTTATIGKGATIGEFAFSETALNKVDLLGKGVTVESGAFATCVLLTDFDFENLSGVVGDFAFALCIAIESVNMPDVTKIGYAAFADCYELASFTAENLTDIGGAAFSPRFGDKDQGAKFTTITAPKLEKIGVEAFLYCKNLVNIDLSNVTTIDIAAFYGCEKLESVTITEKLTDIPDGLFFKCTSLTSIDLSKVKRIGAQAFYKVPLNKDLRLDSVEHVSMYAFIEDEGENRIETVYAPNLITVDEQAFIGCEKLRVITAPKIEEIGSYAFAYTAIEEFQVSDALKVVGSNIFEGCESFKAFYVLDGEGEKVDDKEKIEFEKIMIKDGVLYSKVNKGYVLVAYPAAKEEKEFVIVDGTVRIDFCAALGNKNLETVVFPSSLRYIGDHAFDRCENLATVKFNSYYAPVLEGTMTDDVTEITPDNVGDYPGFEDLYGYNYYYIKEKELIYPYIYHYSTFKGGIGTVADEDKVTCIVPLNSSGYDSRIYKAFFNTSETDNMGTVMGPLAITFIDAVNKLPSVATRFDDALIEAAINAYNALVDNTEEMAFVDASFVEKFNKARSEYNVSVTENKINHLFDMDNSKYSYDIVKDARASYLALTDSERALVTNSAVLDQKIADLALAMGVTLDFSKTYEEHFATEQPEDEEPPVDEEPPAGLDAWVIILIVAGSVIAAGAIAFGVMMFLKKKSTNVTFVQNVASENSAAEELTEVEENEAEASEAEADVADAVAENEEAADADASEAEEKED